MRLPLPGPAALVGAASAVPDAVRSAASLVPRVAAAVGRTEALLDRMESLADRAQAAVVKAEAVAGLAETQVRRVHDVLAVAELTARDAGRTVDGVGGVLDRVDALLATWEPPLRRLAPGAQRFADALDADEVGAGIALVDRLPLVLDHLENDVLPMMRQLDRVGPDLHEILEIVEDLRRVLTGLPGVRMLRRRADEAPPVIEGSIHPDSDRPPD